MFILKFGSKIFVKASDNIKHVSLLNACFDVGEFLYITVSSNVVILLIYDGVISFPSVENLQYAVVSSSRYTSLVPKAREGTEANVLEIPTLFAILTKLSSPKKRCVLTAYILSDKAIADASVISLLG